MRSEANHLQNLREEQNTHLTRELHDELGQSLTALGMLVSDIERDVKQKERQSSSILKISMR